MENWRTYIIPNELKFKISENLEIIKQNFGWPTNHRFGGRCPKTFKALKGQNFDRTDSRGREVCDSRDFNNVISVS